MGSCRAWERLYRTSQYMPDILCFIIKELSRFINYFNRLQICQFDKQNPFHFCGFFSDHWLFKQLAFQSMCLDYRDDQLPISSQQKHCSFLIMTRNLGWLNRKLSVLALFILGLISPTIISSCSSTQQHPEKPSAEDVLTCAWKHRLIIMKLCRSHISYS